MNFRILNFLFTLLISFAFFGCSDENVNDEDCDLESRICSEEFRIISLEILKPDGTPVILDNFYTFYDSRKKFEFDLNNFQLADGIYPVLTDGELEEIDREGTTLIFVGEKDDGNLVEHQMVIGHDCCHIVLIDGDERIVTEE